MEGQMTEVGINLPKTARGEKTLEKIFNSAEKLFEEKGYHETSISEIALNAGIAMGTLYIYFKDKTSLYIYILKRYSHEIRKTSALAAQQYQTRYEQEFYGFKAFLQYIFNHPGAYQIIFESQYVSPVHFKEYYEDFSARYIKWLKAAQDEGEVIACDLVSASYILMGVYTFVGLKKRVFDKQTIVTDQDVENVMHIVKNGLFIKKD